MSTADGQSTDRRPISSLATIGLRMGILGFALSPLTDFALLTAIPAMILGLWACLAIARSHGKLDGQRRAIMGMGLATVGLLVVITSWPPRIQQGRRLQTYDNLRRIGGAIEEYHEAFYGFPPAVWYDRESGYPISWRVRILPYLGPEEEALYDRFRFNEPWDSPHNKSLIPHMPQVYQSPFYRGGDFKTVYLGVKAVSPSHRSVFHSGTGTVRRPDLLGRSSTTAMIVEVVPERAVPWTQPEDWELPIASPGGAWKADLREFDGSGFLTLFADGSIQVISYESGEVLLREQARRLLE